MCWWDVELGGVRKWGVEVWSSCFVVVVFRFFIFVLRVLLVNLYLNFLCF